MVAGQLLQNGLYLNEAQFCPKEMAKLLQILMKLKIVPILMQNCLITFTNLLPASCACESPFGLFRITKYTIAMLGGP